MAKGTSLRENLNNAQNQYWNETCPNDIWAFNEYRQAQFIGKLSKSKIYDELMTLLHVLPMLYSDL